MLRDSLLLLSTISQQIYSLSFMLSIDHTILRNNAKTQSKSLSDLYSSSGLILIPTQLFIGIGENFEFCFLSVLTDELKRPHRKYNRLLIASKPS